MSAKAARLTLVGLLAFCVGLTIGNALTGDVFGAVFAGVCAVIELGILVFVVRLDR